MGHFKNMIVPYQRPPKLHFENFIINYPLDLLCMLWEHGCEKYVFEYFQSKGWKLPFWCYYFYGTEMMHCKTRTLLSDFVAVNSDIVMDGDVMNHVIISQCGELK